MATKPKLNEKLVNLMNDLDISSNDSSSLDTYEIDEPVPPTAVEPDEDNEDNYSFGVSGIKNLANTCFMNASLQCFSALPMFTGYFFTKMFMEDLRNCAITSLANESASGFRKSSIRSTFRKSLTYATRCVLVTMWYGYRAKIEPQKFRKKLAESDLFPRGEQVDAHEFIGYVLDKIHEETVSEVELTQNESLFASQIEEYTKAKKKLNVRFEQANEDTKHAIQNEFLAYKAEHYTEDAIVKYRSYWKKFLKKNHSIIIDLFSGTQMQTTTCSKCNNKSFYFQPENTISLSFGAKGLPVSIEECLRNYFGASEELSGDNAYSCDFCDEKVVAHKKVNLWNTPPYLVLSLKRFVRVGTYPNFRFERINRLVTFPMTGLNLDECCSEYNVDRTESNMYNLSGVVHQFGTLNFGHYVAYTKNPLNGKWYNYNDGRVDFIDDSIVHNMLETNEAYVLIYTKQEYTPIH